MNDAIEEKIQQIGLLEFIRLLRLHSQLVVVGKELRVPLQDLVSYIYGEFQLSGIEGISRILICSKAQLSSNKFPPRRQLELILASLVRIVLEYLFIFR
jgi:hypothetical protein